MNRTDSLINSDAAAVMLGVSRARLWKLSRDGLLPAVRLGRSYRFSLAALREFIDSGGRALEGDWRATSQGSVLDEQE
jgi:excisionase family DNA binding protein